MRLEERCFYGLKSDYGIRSKKERQNYNFQGREGSTVALSETGCEAGFIHISAWGGWWNEYPQVYGDWQSNKALKVKKVSDMIQCR